MDFINSIFLSTSKKQSPHSETVDEVLGEYYPMVPRRVASYLKEPEEFCKTSSPRLVYQRPSGEPHQNEVHSPHTAQTLKTLKDADRIQYEKLVHPLPFPKKFHRISKDFLTFSSEFECGNLEQAFFIAENEYHLLLTPDRGTARHVQWFYFSVKPFKANHTVNFHILNCDKAQSLFNRGLKPVVFSKQKYRASRVQWRRDVHCLKYYRAISKFTLSFTYKFEYYPDTVFFAFAYPYTSKSVTQLLSLQNSRENILRIDPLCLSMLGHTCNILTITDQVCTYAASKKQISQTEHARKKGIVLTARVHPGETHSSYVVAGAIEFLLSDDPAAINLRSRFVFKIVPMLNPDGVIYGNTRCNIIGIDYNRRWDSPNKLVHPEVFHCKKMIEKFGKVHEILMFCDCHGHSIKKHAFMYGCYNYSKSPASYRRNALLRLIPYTLSTLNPNFSFKDSKFRIEPSKRTTSRVVAFKQLKILNSFCLETSMYGSRDHYSVRDLEKLGADLCKSLTIYASSRKLRSSMDSFHTSLVTGNSEQVLEEPAEEFEEILDIDAALNVISEHPLSEDTGLLAPSEVDSDSESESGEESILPTLSKVKRRIKRRATRPWARSKVSLDSPMRIKGKPDGNKESPSNKCLRVYHSHRKCSLWAQPRHLTPEYGSQVPENRRFKQRLSRALPRFSNAGL